MQHPDFRITVSMDEYVKSRLRPIEVPRGYLSNTKEISDGMLTNVKGVNGGLGLLASTARPDMAAPHSIIPSGYDRRSTQLISEVNAAVKQCHAVPITITIWPIPFACRATLDNIHGLKFRHWRATAAPTRLVGVCLNKYFNQERSAPVSVLHWRSRKLTRKAGSPQLVETYAASSAVVEMTWIKALWESMTWRDFDILTQRRSSPPLKTRSETKIQPTVILRIHLLWIPKVCLMHWTKIYHRITENPLWKFQSLKSLFAEQCVDRDGVRTIEMRLMP